MEYKDKILLVDDSEDHRILYSANLKKNYEVKTAGSAEEALDIIKKYTPKLILSDNMMPDMSGVDLCRIIKSDDNLKFIYFIIISAYLTETKDIENGIETGADEYIIKTEIIDGRILTAKVRAGIRIHDLQMDLKNFEHNKAVLNIATTIGHKINNPLASLIMNLQCLQSGLETRDIKDFGEDFQSINKAIARIKKCVETLTNLQNPEVVTYNNGTTMINIDC